MTAKRRSPGDGTLFKRADGMWIARVEIPTEDGKRRQKVVSSKDRGECARKLKEARAQVAAGNVVMTSSTTVGKWLDTWLEDIAGPHIRPTTKRSYEQVLRLHVKPHIGSKRLDRLTAEDIRRMEKTVQQRSQRFAQLAHAVLGKSLKQALVEGHIARNPIDAVMPPRYTPPEQKVFSADVGALLIRTAFARSHMEGCMWATSFTTGLRKSELIGVTWDCVDLDKGELDNAWQLQRFEKGWTAPAGFEARHCTGGLWWTRPKSKAGSRVLPLLPFVVDELRKLKESDTGDNPHNLLFHHPDGRPVTHEAYQDAWKSLLTAADLPDAKGHSIRHTCATILQRAGVDEQTRILLLGHNSAAVTRNYAHIDMSGRRAAVQVDGGLAALLPVAEN